MLHDKHSESLLFCLGGQYYCCKQEESEKGEEEEPELDTMSPSRPLALCAPPTPPTPERYSDEPETYPPTFLTEANGPASCSPPPPPPPPRRCQRAHAFCPSCARCSAPFYLQHPERLCNGGGGRRISYRTVQQQDLELPHDLAAFYQKLLRSYAVKETTTQSYSTDV